MTDESKDQKVGGAVRSDAAQYLRTSSAAQDYSIEMQQAGIAAYAALQGFDITATYIDAGVSGLGVRKRKGLNQMMAAVLSGTAAFQTILVFDVSRWGRFQDPDEAAHYEFLCHQAGVEVRYCAEPFENDGSPTAALIKHIKRVMAAEFSRDLSERVRRAQLGLKSEGFWTCGVPGYGLRRQAVSRDGLRYGTLESGERQNLPIAHTRLIPAAEDEVAVVHRIYRDFLAGASFTSLAARLNAEQTPGEGGALWTIQRIRSILTNPKYVGDLIYGQWVSILGDSLVRVDPALWLTAPAALPALVDRDRFDAVQERVAERRRPVSDDDLLDELRRLLSAHGFLNDGLIRREGRWSPTPYTSRFGNLPKAFAAIGYAPTYPQFSLMWKLSASGPLSEAEIKRLRLEHIDGLRLLLKKHGRLSHSLIDRSPDVPSRATFKRWFGSLAEAYALVPYEPRLHKRGPSVSRKGSQRPAAHARESQPGIKSDYASKRKSD